MLEFQLQVHRFVQSITRRCAWLQTVTAIRSRLMFTAIHSSVLFTLRPPQSPKCQAQGFCPLKKACALPFSGRSRLIFSFFLT